MPGTLYLLESNTFPALKSLIVADCLLKKNDLHSLGVASESGRLPELTHLDISGNRHIGIGNLSLLLRVEFRSLQALILNSCLLNERDLRALARANAEGKFPELKYLDISGNHLEQSLEVLTRDPDTDRKVSWQSVKCDNKYLGDDYE